MADTAYAVRLSVLTVLPGSDVLSSTDAGEEPNSSSLLAGETLPCGLPGHPERRADPRPAHPAVAQPLHPDPQVVLHLGRDRGDPRQVVEHLLVGHRLPVG